jgi:hypothetical protein
MGFAALQCSAANPIGFLSTNPIGILNTGPPKTILKYF